MTKANLKKQKSKSKLQIIFDEGTKFVCRTFVAFSLASPNDPFTSTNVASKKVGNAVKRNRAKRRLREITRLHISPNIAPIRLILLARSDTYKTNFSLLLDDSKKLVKKINEKLHFDQSVT